jgi:predicted permease
VISYALWRRAFAADPAAVGAGVRFNGVPAMIVGIAPPGFSGTSLDGSADFWLSAEGFSQLLPSRALTDRRHRSFTILGRLAAGVSAGAAEAKLAGIAASLARIDPQAWTDATGATRRVTVMKETDARFASSPGAIPALLGGATAAIVAIVGIACINIATLLLARGAARTRELTIRLAIGASRGRLLRQLATESLVIAILGTAVALAVVSAGIRIFAAYRPEGVPAVDLAVDWRVVLFAATAASLATILCGLLPAAHLVRLAVAEGLKGRAAAVRTRWLRAGAREALIVVQVTASVALLLASAVFTHGLSTGRAASPGFVTEGIVTMAVDLGNAATDARGASRRLIAAVERVAGPGATAVGAVIPLTGTAISAEITGAGIGSRVVDGNVVSPGYLPMLGIALRRGRDFSERDTGSAPGVVIVNETLARALWRSIDVVGRSFTLSGRPVEVVGVAADTRYRSVSQPFPPLVYSPLEQVPRQRFIIHLRTTGGPQVLSAIEAAARAVDARIMIDGAVPIEKRLQDVRVAERLATLGGAAGGAIQFGLVLMAVWALVAYAVERRTHEIGVRRALGAPERSVVAMLLKPAVLLISAGAVLGTCAGWTAASVLQSEFVGLAPLELSAGLPAIAAMLVVAVAAAWLPARRAAQVDPIAALRAD